MDTSSQFTSFWGLLDTASQIEDANSISDWEAKTELGQLRACWMSSGSCGNCASTVCGSTSHSHPASTIVFKSLSDCHTCAPSLPLVPAKSSSQVGHPCTRAFTNWHVCPLLRDAYLSVPSKGDSKGVEATSFSKGSICFCLSAILGLSSMQTLFPNKLMSAPAFMICKPLRWQPCGLMRAPLRFLGWTTKAVAFAVAT